VPQAQASNEKMKLVFQLTEQQHFTRNNQAFYLSVGSLCL